MNGNGNGGGRGRQCGAKTRGGGACKRAAGSGTDHIGIGRCKLHGGSTPNHQKAARNEQAEQAVEQYGLPVETTPIQALSDELYRAAGHVAWLGQQVRDIEEGNMYGPVGGGGESAIPRQEPHVWIRMYNEERDRLAGVAAICVKLGLDERRVRIAEAQGQVMAQVIRGVLEGLGIDPTSDKARKVVRKQLTAASGPREAIEGVGSEKVAA